MKVGLVDSNGRLDVKPEVKNDLDRPHHPAANVLEPAIATFRSYTQHKSSPDVLKYDLMIVN